jgi:hypothetical protein
MSDVFPSLPSLTPTPLHCLDSRAFEVHQGLNKTLPDILSDTIPMFNIALRFKNAVCYNMIPL